MLFSAQCISYDEVAYCNTLLQKEVTVPTDFDNFSGAEWGEDYPDLYDCYFGDI